MKHVVPASALEIHAAYDDAHTAGNKDETNNGEDKRRTRYLRRSEADVKNKHPKSGNHRSQPDKPVKDVGGKQLTKFHETGFGLVENNLRVPHEDRRWGPYGNAYDRLWLFGKMQDARKFFFGDPESASADPHPFDSLLLEESIDAIGAKSQYIGDFFDRVVFRHLRAGSQTF